MAFIPAPGVAQVEMVYLKDGEKVENVYHVAPVAGGTALPSLANIANAFEQWESADAKQFRTDDVTLTDIRVTNLSDESTAVYDLPASIQGTGSASTLPNNVTFALKFNAAGRGRGKQGRTFWIGVIPGNTSGSNMSVEQANALVTSYAGLRTFLTELTPSVDLAVMHQQVDGVKINPRTYTMVSSVAYTNLNLDSQRDRLPGHRRNKRKHAVVVTP